MAYGTSLITRGLAVDVNETYSDSLSTRGFISKIIEQVIVEGVEKAYVRIIQYSYFAKIVTQAFYSKVSSFVKYMVKIDE